MGTHPIFESDFDCLTDKKMNLNTERNLQSIGNTQRIKPNERQTLGVVHNTNNQGALREITDIQETITAAPIADMEPIDGCLTEQNQFKKTRQESFGIQTEVAEKFNTMTNALSNACGMPFRWIKPTFHSSSDSLAENPEWFDAFDSQNQSQQMSPKYQTEFDFKLIDTNWDY